jgi:FixJ family two-component response regulator
MTGRSKKDPLAEALEAHLAVLGTQNQMRDAAALRDRSIRAAIAAGYSTKDIAAHIGVTQRRVQAMAGTKERGTE